MKTLKIVGAVLVLALLIVGATLASAIAFGWGGRTPLNPQAAVGDFQVNAPQVLSPVTQTNMQTPTLYTPTLNSQAYQGYGGGRGGCMGRWGWGTNGYPTTTTATAISITQAIDVVKSYVASLNNADLKVTHVEEYQNNFYVAVGEKSTGNGAFELLINKYTGIVTPEPGPNMMWNIQYTFGGGWCNWARGIITTPPTVNVEQAKIYAQQYLDTYIQGAGVGDVTTFSGYYTIEVLNNGAPFGMLSVNSFTGQVWYHTWHGAFVQEQIVS